KLKLAILPVKLIGDSVCAHASRDRGVHAHAGGQTGVGVGDWSRRLYGPVTDLNLHALSIAQERELTDALEVVVFPVHGVNVRVSIVRAIVGCADLEPEDSLVLAPGGVRRG